MRKYFVLAGIALAILTVGSLAVFFQFQRDWKGWLYVGHIKVRSGVLIVFGCIYSIPWRLVSLYKHLRGLSFRSISHRKTNEDYREA